MKKVVMYINQFYAGIGGEDKAGTPPQIQTGVIGPAAVLNGKLDGGEITHTIFCGDDYMNEHEEEALRAIDSFLGEIEFDLLIAGPAFFAGRYGMNCGRVCQHVQKKYKVPAFTSMFEEAPGVEIYRSDIYILRGGRSGAAMKKNLTKMAEFANKLLNNTPILWAEAEGYFSRGIRAQVSLPEDQTVDRRAVDMLLKKLSGEPYESELPIELLEPVPVPPALRDTGKARIAYICTGGIVPEGNPDHISSAGATKFAAYELPEDTMKPGEWESVHGGYNQSYANANPMVFVPVDAMRKLQREGRIGYLHSYFYSTTGNLTNLKDARRMANEIVECLKKDQIQAAVLTSA